MTFDIRFKTPFNCIISGPSGSGKTTWVKNLLKYKSLLFDKEPKYVILYYTMMQSVYTELKSEGLIDEMIHVSQSFPSVSEISQKVHKYKEEGSLLIFDDMVTMLTADFENIFLNLSHHENASVVFMTQNLFYKDKVYRNISLNTHYFVLMKNNRDSQQISILAKQICPGNSAYIVQSYKDATQKPYSYLLLDFRPETSPSIRLRTDIFPSDNFPPKVYLEK